MRALWNLCLIVVLVLAGVIAFLFSGRYDIAAATPHTSIVKSLISLTVDHSVKRHARDVQPPPNLQDTSLARLGFVHFREMCVECHGAPGVPREEFAEGLYPRAPKLQKAAKEWSAGELYWMTKNGIKMSGMPAFGKTHDEHALWAIVAFLQKLPEMDSGAYAAYQAATPEGDAAGELEGKDEGRGPAGHFH
jgi:mono/diheme cytochrome c family protein